MSAEGSAGIMNIVIMMVILVGMYFLMIRPSTKRKKQEDEMRNNIQIGDEITTIGGIIGRVVAIKDENESFIIETGVDRSKIKIKKWAIATCNTQKENNQAK
ncbi:preprotein translocase YajC subunit [Clostridium sp. CAG:557]|jgi:preprotein translocase subunit YajC|nr:preprotein translocase YajC subunit [Clostridium sp. CAG:557]